MSLGRGHLRYREIQESGRLSLNQGVQQDHVLLDCGCQPWLRGLRTILGPATQDLDTRKLERVRNGKRLGFATRALLLHSGCQLESLGGLQPTLMFVPHSEMAGHQDFKAAL